MNPQQFDAYRDQVEAMWQMGDYEALIQRFTTIPPDLLDQLAVKPPARVLDVACGTGATALFLAKQGLDVTGVDLTPRMIEVARGKAGTCGLEVAFDRGAAEALPYGGACFDLTMSMFGVMFSPMPQAVVSELARVLKPRGRLVLANWANDGFSMRMGRVFSAHMPRKAVDAPPPPDWGSPEGVRAILAPAFHRIKIEVKAMTWTLDVSARHAARIFMRQAGPLAFLIGSMKEGARKSLTDDIEHFWEGNSTVDTNGHVNIENTYLSISAEKYDY